MKYKKVVASLLCFFSVFIIWCQQEAKATKLVVEATQLTVPIIKTNFTLIASKKIVKVKQAIQQGDTRFLPAYKKLLKDADHAMEEGVFSVTQKSQVAPSGDKHDYLSLAPYWWPDPTKIDGLPWIRKDGEINPMTRGSNVDDPGKDKMISNVKNLSLAFLFSNHVVYAEKTKELIRVWFLEESTRMNPNLDYAQGVPGKSDGRGFGII